jgi:D-arabinono-1,4-lactone oxidase
MEPRDQFDQILTMPDDEFQLFLGTMFPGQPPRLAFAGIKPDIEQVSSANGIYHAMSVYDVQTLVAYARDNNLKVRVEGSGHSADPAIFSTSPDDLRIVLDGELRSVQVLSQNAGGALVKAGGGCYLGKNPADKSSTWANSLNAQLEALGVSLPILGGISHQSVAGFMQTSSSGGSTRYGFADAVAEIEIVDGSAHVQTLKQGSDEFNAIGVGLGLFGVITHVTLFCQPRYFVEGTEANFEVADSLLVKNADGHYLLESALATNDYMHLNWFPQKKVKRVMQWVGQQRDQMEPFKPYDSELRGTFMNRLASIALAIGNLLQLGADNPFFQAAIGALLKKFVEVGKPKDFHDFWYRALPADDEVDTDGAIQIQFTEIWLPVSQLTTALDRLKAAIEPNQRMAGNFAVELYGAKNSPFWMSPANNRPDGVVRVDVFWWAKNIGSRQQFFTYYWNELLDLDGARLHWGKFLPAVGQKYGNATFGPGFIRGGYADHIKQWLQLRQSFDPVGVFLTDYWRLIFGI